MSSVVGSHGDRFLLHTSAITYLKSGRDFTCFAGASALLRTRGSATAGGGNGLNGNRFVAFVLIFEMADRGVVSHGRMQLQQRLFPDEFGMQSGSETSNHEDEQNFERSVHSRMKRAYNFSVKRYDRFHGLGLVSIPVLPTPALLR